MFFSLFFLSFNLKPLCFCPPTEIKCCVHFILSTCSSSKINLLSVIVWSCVVLKVDSPVAGIVLHFISDYTLCLWEPCSGFPAYWAVQWSWFARVNAPCNLSRKKSREVTASLPDPFLSRRCFTLCITMEIEPRIVKQYECHHCCSCKNYRGKGMEGGEKCLCVVFWLTRSSRVHEKNVFWGILQHKQQVIACCQTRSDYGPPKCI